MKSKHTTIGIIVILIIITIVLLVSIQKESQVQLKEKSLDGLLQNLPEGWEYTSKEATSFDPCGQKGLFYIKFEYLIGGH